MSKILTRVAIAAGAGLAFGLTSITPPPPRKRLDGSLQPQPPATDDILDLEPLLDRIEVLERRLDLTPGVDPGQMQELRDQLPALVDAAVESRIADLQAGFQAEIEESRRQTLEAFTQTIEAVVTQKVSDRFEALERTLLDQSSSIAMLREHVELTDTNLQRLVAAIERLVDRSPMRSGPASANASFQDHLDDALSNKPAESRPEPREPEAPRLGVREAEPAAARKSRFPLNRFF